MGWPRKASGTLHEFSLKVTWRVNASITVSWSPSVAQRVLGSEDFNAMEVYSLEFIHLNWKHRWHLFLILVILVLPDSFGVREEVTDFINYLQTVEFDTRKISCLVIFLILMNDWRTESFRIHFCNSLHWCHFKLKLLK